MSLWTRTRTRTRRFWTRKCPDSIPEKNYSIGRTRADVNAIDNHGVTPLHLAAGKASLIEELLSQDGAEGLHSTPTHDATDDSNMTEIVALLLKYGADVNSTTQSGETPLYYAAVEGHFAIAKLLIQNKADINYKDQEGFTPLHIAAYCGQSKIVELLLKFGARKDLKNNGFETPLQTAKRVEIFNIGDNKKVIALLENN